MLEKSGLGTSQPCVLRRIDEVGRLVNRQVPFGARYNHRRRGESRAHSRAGAPCPLDRQLCGGHMKTAALGDEPTEPSCSPCAATKAIAALSFAHNHCASGCLPSKYYPQRVLIDDDRCAHAACQNFAWRRSPDTEHAAPLLERRKRITTAQNSIRLNRTTAIKRERQFSINKQQIAKNKTKDSGVNVRRKLGAHHMKKLQVDHLVGRARVCPARATRNMDIVAQAPPAQKRVLSQPAPHSGLVKGPAAI